jgi:hypothetical protein
MQVAVEVLRLLMFLQLLVLVAQAVVVLVQ